MKNRLIVLLVLGFSIVGNAQDSIKRPVVVFQAPQQVLNEQEQGAVVMLLVDYFSALEYNEFNNWKACYGDTIQKYVSPKRFGNKFERLKGYGFGGDTIRVIVFQRLSEHLGREPGQQYQLVLDFGKDLNVVNRVSADHLKVYKTHESPKRFGITIVQYNDKFRVDMLKYQADGTVTWE